MTAISTWLAELIDSRHGHRPTVVPMSGDPEVFYPRGDRPREGKVRVVAMLRPDERRGFRYLVPALEEVGKHPNVEIVLFGSYRVADAPFPYQHAGLLSRDGVAKLLSTAHVVVDPSLFQGFGLVGLEAMSSGAACVLTDSGGVMEYAVDGVNALIVPPRDARALAAAILKLVDDRALRERLAEAGLATGRRLTWRKSAEIFATFLRSLPPAEPPSELAKAALAALWKRDRAAAALAASRAREVEELRATLSTIQGSRIWKLLVDPYWRLKAKLR